MNFKKTKNELQNNKKFIKTTKKNHFDELILSVSHVQKGYTFLFFSYFTLSIICTGLSILTENTISFPSFLIFTCLKFITGSFFLVFSSKASISYRAISCGMMKSFMTKSRSSEVIWASYLKLDTIYILQA